MSLGQILGTQFLDELSPQKCVMSRMKTKKSSEENPKIWGPP